MFVSVPTEVGQTEAEEIGVEHLLRNVKVGTCVRFEPKFGQRARADRVWQMGAL